MLKKKKHKKKKKKGMVCRKAFFKELLAVKSCQVSLKNASCHKFVYFPVLIRACNLFQLGLAICDFFFFWSPTTLAQHSSFPLKANHLNQFRPTLIRTLAS